MRYSSRVVPYYPRGPRPALLLIGEAPGPRGADRTGYPFWGDDSGLLLYQLVADLGLLDAPFVPWKRRADLSGTCPPAGRYCITNACPQMPLGEHGATFAAPAPARLEYEAERVARELQELDPRVILACGRAAAFTLARASERLGIAPPPALARKTFGSTRLTDAMAQLVDAPPEEAWRIGGALAFVTCHPARGQWAPGTPSGKLHARIVERIASRLGSRSHNH